MVSKLMIVQKLNYNFVCMKPTLYQYYKLCYLNNIYNYFFKRHRRGKHFNLQGRCMGMGCMCM